MQAIPVALAINNTRASIPNIIITNSGSQRFDVYAGPFTKNDLLTATPFTDSFKFIPNVTFSVANQVLSSLNNAGANVRRVLQEVLQKRENKLYARGYVDKVYRRWLEEMDRRNKFEWHAATNLSLGYVTTDVRCTFFLRISFPLTGAFTSLVQELATMCLIYPFRSFLFPISSVLYPLMCRMTLRLT